jgi:hypothetical protein
MVICFNVWQLGIFSPFWLTGNPALDQDTEALMLLVFGSHVKWCFAYSIAQVSKNQGHTSRDFDSFVGRRLSPRKTNNWLLSLFNSHSFQVREISSALTYVAIHQWGANRSLHMYYLIVNRTVNIGDKLTYFNFISYVNGKYRVTC